VSPATAAKPHQATHFIGAAFFKLHRRERQALSADCPIDAAGVKRRPGGIAVWTDAVAVTLTKERGGWRVEKAVSRKQ